MNRIQQSVLVKGFHKHSRNTELACDGIRSRRPRSERIRGHCDDWCAGHRMREPGHSFTSRLEWRPNVGEHELATRLGACRGRGGIARARGLKPGPVEPFDDQLLEQPVRFQDQHTA